MAQKKNIFQKYRFVFQPSPLVLKFALLITILVAVVSLSVLGGYIANIHAQTENLRHYAGELEQQINQLQDKKDKQDTVEGVKDVAGEELGMVDGDATVIPVE
jgi:hypothetical protein